MGLPQTFLAPWAALLTVNATVFGTLRTGVQQVAATAIGVLLAFGAAALVGVNALSLGVAVLAGMVAGGARGLRDESTTAAATALVVLTTGSAEHGHLLLARLADTGIGVGVGLLVNLAVWPPLRDRAAAHRVDAIDDRLGELLRDVAAGFRSDAERRADAWIARTDELDEDIDHARTVLAQARESGRLNVRRSARERMARAHEFEDVLHRLEQANAEVRSMARTIRLAPGLPEDWGPRFRDPWLDLLDETARAVIDADAAGLARVRARLDAFARAFEPAALPYDLWPVCGALIVNLRNIVASLDVVAAAQPVQVPPPAVTVRPRAGAPWHRSRRAAAVPRRGA